MSQLLKSHNWVITLLHAALFCAACAIVLIISSAVMKQPGIWPQIAMAGMACVGSMLLTLLFAKWDGIRLADVGVVPGRFTARRVALGVAIGGVLATVQLLLVLFSGHVTLLHTQQVSMPAVFLSLLLYILLALREEISFRGYPLQRLNSVIGPIWAQVIIAVIFSIEHKAGGMAWLQSLWGPGVGALLFGIAAIKTRGIALPFGIHAAWNFTQWLVGVKNDTGIYKLVVEKGYESHADHAATLSYLAVMAVAIGLFYLRPPKQVTR